jgi:hypothetical protein
MALSLFNDPLLFSACFSTLERDLDLLRNAQMAPRGLRASLPALHINCEAAQQLHHPGR